MTNEKKQELDALCLKFRRTLIEILHERHRTSGRISFRMRDPYKPLF